LDPVHPYLLTELCILLFQIRRRKKEIEIEILKRKEAKLGGENKGRETIEKRQ